MNNNLFYFIIGLSACLFSVSFGQTTCNGPVITELAKIQELLQEWNDTLTDMTYDVVEAEWNWATDISTQHEEEKAKQNAIMAEKFKELWKAVACINCTMAGCSPEEARRINSYSSIDTAALPPQKYSDYGVIQTAMENIYATAKVCLPDDSKCLPLDPDLSELLTTSNDYCELQWAWEGWRNETGRKMRGYYTGYVLLQNEAANMNGFDSAKEMWTKSYWKDEPDFFDQIEDAWQEVLPLYKELHAFARRKLQTKYDKSYFPASGHIPAHVFGNMWAQDWDALYNLLVPYPEAPEVDVTQLMLDKGWTEMRLFNESDLFFQSIGLGAMTNDFWHKSVFLRKPKPIEMVCHASAWDFYQKTDFRVKMCTVVTQGDFQTVHHEMGHIQYYMQYKDQPVEFRNGANPGFHEAIGDLIALSVMTPGHLKAIKLLPEEFEEDDRTSMNALMSMALQKVPFLPFGYLMDKFRWGVFKRDTSFSNLNAEWWKLRCDMQGVTPPVPRTEEDFDPGAKYHIPASVPYIRYFFSHIAQFQFHRAICQQMGYTKDFHKCDIYNNVTATKVLRDAMAMGSSVPYPEVMKVFTGSEKLDSSAILDYFEPLYKWLQLQNKGQTTGWTPGDCPKITRNSCNYNNLIPTNAPPTNAPTTPDGGIANSPSKCLLIVMLSFLAVILAEFAL